MNYSCSRYELKCNECGKRFGNQPLSACPDCLAPLEISYDLEAVRGIFTRENIAAGPANIWRYAALLPIPGRFPARSPRRLYSSRPRKKSRQAHRRDQSLRQERRRLLPNSQLQRSRRLGRPRQRAEVRLRHRRLLLYRQSRQLSRRASRTPGPQGHHPRPR